MHGALHLSLFKLLVLSRLSCELCCLFLLEASESAGSTATGKADKVVQAGSA